MTQIQPTLNIANKVRNTKLPRTKPLMPLFEIVSNSIHAIKEREQLGRLKKGEGEIVINCIRNGDEEALKLTKEINTIPIHSFKVTDNGIGLNTENLTSFIEADTEHKINIGGKGVGRFICLKAFRELHIYSEYIDDDQQHKAVEFDFKNTKIGFENFATPPSKGKIGTTILLSRYNQEYQRGLDFNLHSIATELVSHFQLYFIRSQAPKIIVRNQDNNEYNLQTLFRAEFKSDVQEKEFHVKEEKFVLYLTKSLKIQSHKIHFCAHNRSVISEGLYSRLIDLGKYPIKDEENGFFYQAYVVGDILDKYVDTERVGFNFPMGNDDEESEEDTEQITFAKIRRGAINCIEDVLSDYLNNVRSKKIDSYKPIIYDELPQYRSTLTYRKNDVAKLPPGLSKEKLDIELYKIETQWRLDVKQEKQELLAEKKDVTNYHAYVEKYERFLSKFNEIGKGDLARYVVHRKTIIELLENLIEQNEQEKFENEDLIHSIFFPIRTTSDEVITDKQNLWLIDERLTYHSFLASDKTFNSIPQVQSTSTNRADLLIYNEALAFSESKAAPHNIFTIVEFKKPMRDNYEDYDEKKNPIEQAEKYIDDLLAGKVTGRNGRLIEVNPSTPFYVYIVCDITPSLEKILTRREFQKTPDGKGYFKVKGVYYSAYFEILPFEKVLDDAKKRNRILFEKLNIL